MPPPNEEEPHDEDEDKKKKGEEAPLDLNYNIEELESDQQEADKSGESFLIKRNAVMAGRHRIVGSGALELLSARITRAMAACGRTGPQGSMFSIKQRGPPNHGTGRGRSERDG